MRVLLALAMLLALGMLNPAPVGAVTTWRVAVLVYESVDVVCHDRLVRATLPPGEADETYTLIERGVATIEGWGAAVDIQLTRIDAGTLTSVTERDDGSCYPAPDNIVTMGDWPCCFDSVAAIHENDNDETGAYLHGWGGFNWACGACSGPIGAKATYHTQPIFDGSADYIDHMDYGLMIFPHEWSHPVAEFYRQQVGEAQVPQFYTDRSQFDTDDFLRDMLSGHLRYVGSTEEIGLEPWVWALGTPTGTASPTPSPTPKVCKNPTSNAKACR